MLFRSCVEQSDAAFIAAASPDVVLAMASEIELLNKEIKSLKEIEYGLSEDNFSLCQQHYEDGKKIAQLEKEADWLAEHISTLCGQIEDCNACAYGDGAYCSIDRFLGDDPEIWREAARNAIAQGNANDRQ